VLALGLGGVAAYAWSQGEFDSTASFVARFW